MKKFAVLALVSVLVLTLFAGCGKAEPEAPVATPGSALEILETVWANYSEDEKFSVIGGNIEANIMDAPGNYDMTYAENMTWNLLVPADKIGNISEAASMIHMMNSNTFTCGVYKLNSISAADFGAAMQQAVQGNQWMCGFPDSLLIRSVGDSYVIVAFGVNDAMTTFEKHLTAAYPGFETLYNEAIG